jgi:hypothetical protein
MAYISEEIRCFEGIYDLHLQGLSVSQEENGSFCVPEIHGIKSLKTALFIVFFHENLKFNKFSDVIRSDF